MWSLTNNEMNSGLFFNPKQMSKWDQNNMATSCEANSTHSESGFQTMGKTPASLTRNGQVQTQINDRWVDGVVEWSIEISSIVQNKMGKPTQN